MLTADVRPQSIRAPSATTVRPALSVRPHFVLTICLPLAGVVAAVLLSWQQGAGTVELSSCAIMFVLTLIGVEVGFHRHFAHRSFKAVRAVRVVLAGLGSMALQGSVIWWTGVHRVHHRHADRPEDPHSPLDGFVHAHVGWLFRNLDPPNWRRRAPDLFRDDVARTATRMYYVWVAAGFALPALGAALATRSWHGLLLGFLWGGLVRIFLVNHVVWSINSMCHTFGNRPYQTKDSSRNNALLSLPTLGIAWHNNHHAFPGSATNSHHWWQLDLSGLFILCLRSLGLVWDVGSAGAYQGRRDEHAQRPPVWKGAGMRLAIGTIRALESALPRWCLQCLAWPAAAMVSAWQLARDGRLPSSFRPDPSPAMPVWSLWRQRVNLNLTKLMVFWPDRLMEPRWRSRCDAAGLRQLKRLIAEDRPVVLAVLHFGPVAVIKYWMRAEGLAVAGLVLRRLEDRPAYRVYLDTLNDAASGLGGIPQLLDFTQLRQAVDFIRPQRLLMVAVEGGGGHEVFVEGEEYVFRMATGAIRLAARAHGLVVPCLALAHGPFRLTLHVGTPVAADGDPRAVCAHVMDAFTPILRAHPGQCERELLRSFRALAREPAALERRTRPA